MKINQQITETLENVGEEMRQNSRKAFLAGLGAISSVEERGRKVFETLVERGERREVKDLGVAKVLDQAVDQAKNLGREMVGGFEARVTTTLERFGVPTSHQIRGLIDQVERLTQKVESLAHN